MTEPHTVSSGLSALSIRSRSVIDPQILWHFLDTFLYRQEAVLLDEITTVDTESKRIEAVFETTRPLPFAKQQRTSPNHPAHVSGPELILATASLGCLHAYLFYGCRWDEGWAGFGNRIHRADFKQLASIGPPIELVCCETRGRIGPARIVLRFDFEFRQQGKLVYRGDQTAMFIKEKKLG
jgi:hypothetical protein